MVFCIMGWYVTHRRCSRCPSCRCQLQLLLVLISVPYKLCVPDHGLRLCGSGRRSSSGQDLHSWGARSESSELDSNGVSRPGHPGRHWANDVTPYWRSPTWRDLHGRVNSPVEAYIHPLVSYLDLLATIHSPSPHPASSFDWTWLLPA